MKTIFALLLILAASISIAGDGIKLQGALGDCRYTGSPNGQWWQADHEHSNDFKDRCGEVGVSAPIQKTGFSAYARFVTLGRAHTRALAQTYPDDDGRNLDAALDNRRAECTQAFNPDNCLYYWTGDGGAKGIALGFSHELFSIGRVRFDGELGAFVHQIKWNNQVYPLDCDDPRCQWRVTIDQKSRYQIAPMVGVTAQLDIAPTLDLYIAFREYYRIGEHVSVTAGIKGPVEQWLIGLQKTF